MKNQMLKKLIHSLILMILLMASVTYPAQHRGSQADRIKTCSDISLARAGSGVGYRGLVENDDYHLSIVIPSNLMGWGADRVAPFHGFTIFLPGQNKIAGCVVFEIHHRVDLGDETNTREGSTVRSIKLGNIEGSLEERAGEINGTALKNVTITFLVEEVDEGSVWLITPMKDLKKNLPIFDRFVSQVRFGDRTK
jgi:hypothetical protein